MVDRFMVLSLIHILALNINDVQLGTIAGVYGLFNVIGYVPSGILAEKFNTKKLLILSCGAMCLVTLWYSSFPGYTALIIIHALYGIFSVGTFWSPYLKAIRNLGSENEQGRLFGISEGLRGIGQTAVAFLCLWAMGLFATQAAGFRAVLLINAAAFAPVSYTHLDVYKRQWYRHSPPRSGCAGRCGW